MFDIDHIIPFARLQGETDKKLGVFFCYLFFASYCLMSVVLL